LNRLHILKRFYQYLGQADGLAGLGEAALYGRYRALLAQAYQDFEQSTPAQDRIVAVDLDARRLQVERRAEGGVQLLDTTLPSLITMMEGSNEMRFTSLDDRLRAGRFAVRRWNKDDAGIEDVGKIGLKGSPTIVSKVFGPTPRSEKADVQGVADSSVQDVTLNLLQKIFTRHPQLEQELVERLSA